MRTINCLFAIFFFTGIAEAQELKLMEDSVAIGATITLQWKTSEVKQADSLLLVWKKCDDPNKPVLQAGPIAQVDIEVLDVDPAKVKVIGDTIVLKEPSTYEEIKFRLFDVGKFCLWLGDSLVESITIVGPHPSSSDLEDIHPIEPFQNRSYSSIVYWLFLGLILVAGLWYFRKYWFQKKEKKVQKIDLPGARELALNRLKQVMFVLEKEGKKEWAVDEMTQTLRNYIHFAYAIQAEEMTSDELISALNKSNHPIVYLAQVKEVFQKTDLYKFAKMPLEIEELKSFVGVCIEFVQKNPTVL